MKSNGDAGNALTSGALAGMASVLIMQPLDVVKTRLQEHPTTNLSWCSRAKNVICSTYKDNGIRGFWRGTTPTLIRNVPGVSVYFVTLHQLQYLILIAHQRNIPFLNSLYDENSKRLSGKGNLISGAIARTFAGSLLMPATLLKVRFESSQYKYSSITNAITTIFKTEGIPGFFRGIGATALRDAPHAGLYLFFYETLKPLLFPSSSVGKLLSGATSGFVATMITQPFDLVKTRIQLSKDPRNFVETLAMVIKSEGFRGLFSGIGPRLLRKSLSSAVTWTVYEELASVWKNNNRIL